jgi:hypothetical protein
MVLLSKSGSMTVKVLHSQGSSVGKRLRRKALGPPRTICKNKGSKTRRADHVWVRVSSIFEFQVGHSNLNMSRTLDTDQKWTLTCFQMAILN